MVALERGGHPDIESHDSLCEFLQVCENIRSNFQNLTSSNQLEAGQTILKRKEAMDLIANVLDTLTRTKSSLLDLSAQRTLFKVIQLLTAITASLAPTDVKFICERHDLLHRLNVAASHLIDFRIEKGAPDENSEQLIYDCLTVIDNLMQTASLETIFSKLMQQFNLFSKMADLIEILDVSINCLDTFANFLQTVAFMMEGNQELGIKILKEGYLLSFMKSLKGFITLDLQFN